MYLMYLIWPLTFSQMNHHSAELILDSDWSEIPKIFKFFLEYSRDTHLLVLKSPFFRLEMYLMYLNDLKIYDSFSQILRMIQQRR